MQQSETQILEALLEIRNWIRAAAHNPVRMALEEALPDEKTRMAYQMLDGRASVEEVRTACKMSPNAVIALTSRCTSMGLMEARPDKKRVRLFDLADFGMVGSATKSRGKL